MKRIIYADNAATTQMSPLALDTMMHYLKEEYGNASQPYSFARGPQKALKNARRIIANCINASPDEIYFTSGGSESDNWAIKNAILHNKVIATSTIEHHAILNACEFAAKNGMAVNLIPSSSNGILTPGDIKEALSEQSLLSIMLANNELGTIEPISQYSLLAKDYSSIMHTDAVQAVGHIDVDVKELGVDMLSASGHKFNGPKGIGFLYVKRGIDIEPLIHGGGQEFNKRAGTENIASIMAMAFALRENVVSLEDNQKHLYHLEEIILDKLSKAKIDYKRNGINQLPGLLSLSFVDADGEAILHRMDLMGISISTGSACDSKDTHISHVLQAIGLEEKYAKGTVRISLGKYNTTDDAIRIAESLIKIVKETNN